MILTIIVILLMEIDWIPYAQNYPETLCHYYPSVGRKMILLFAVSICQNNPTKTPQWKQLLCTGGGFNIYWGYLLESNCKRLSGCSWRTVTESDWYDSCCSFCGTKTCGGTAWWEIQRPNRNTMQNNEHYSCDWGGGGNGDGQISWGGRIACFVAIFAVIGAWIWFLRRRYMCQSPADDFEQQQHVDDNKDSSSSSIVEPTSVMNLHDDENEDEQSPPSASPPIVSAIAVDDVRIRPSPQAPPHWSSKCRHHPLWLWSKTLFDPMVVKKWPRKQWILTAAELSILRLHIPILPTTTATTSSSNSSSSQKKNRHKRKWIIIVTME